jgi:hypothetical protein
MSVASTALPDNAGYVAAAYLVFLALILVYVAIMAYKLIQVGRDAAELDTLADGAREADRTPADGEGPRA